MLHNALAAVGSFLSRLFFLPTLARLFRRPVPPAEEAVQYQIEAPPPPRRLSPGEFLARLFFLPTLAKLFRRQPPPAPDEVTYQIEAPVAVRPTPGEFLARLFLLPTLARLFQRRPAPARVPATAPADALPGDALPGDESDEPPLEILYSPPWTFKSFLRRLFGIDAARTFFRRLFRSAEALADGRNDIYNEVVLFKARMWQRLAWVMCILALAGFGVSILMYYRYTPARPIARVGKTVFRNRDYQEKLDNTVGRAVLTRMIFGEIVRQAGARARVTPTPLEIAARIAERRRQGQLRGPLTDDAREILVLDMTLDNLRMRGITASDAEVAAYYHRHARQLALPGQTHAVLVVTATEMLAAGAVNLLRAKQTEAQIAAVPGMHVDGQAGFRVDLSTLPPALSQKITRTVLAMRPGQITTVPVGTSFLTIECTRRIPAVLPPLPAIRDQVARMVKLEKAPSADAEMATLYQQNRPDFDNDRYAAYFRGIDNAAAAAPKMPAPSRPKAAPPSPRTASAQ